VPALRPQNLPGDGRLPRRRSPLTARTYVAPHPTARTHQSPRLHVVTCRPQAHKRRNKVGSMRNVHRPRNRSCSDSVPRGHNWYRRFHSGYRRRVRVKPRRCRQVSHDWRSPSGRQHPVGKALTNISVPTTTANPTRRDPSSESDRTFGSPLDPYTRGGGQAPRATKIKRRKSTMVEFSTNTGDRGTHENRGFGPETRPIAAGGASARSYAF